MPGLRLPALGVLRPRQEIDPATLQRGLRWLTGEVVFSSVSDSMMAGALLTAFALFLGARAGQVGVLAGVAFFAQLLQGPGVLLVDRLRLRKLIAVVCLCVSAAAPAAMAVLAFAAPSPAARWSLLGAVTLYCGAGALSGCAWSAWTRDLIPRGSRGDFLARRSRVAILATVAMAILASIVLDQPGERAARAGVFAALYVLAFVAQLLNAATLAQAPEPMMPPTPPGARKRMLQLLKEPLADPDFRSLIRFSASWQFAVNLAQPFFTVFFIKRLGFDIGLVMALTIVNQLASGWGLKRWGALIDRFGDKSVLNLAAPVFIACIAAMVGASQFESRLVAAGYLVVVHVVMGLAGAGVTLASGSLALKLSPRGDAAPYLSANALISSFAGGVAPVLGGLCAQLFAERRVGFVLEWSGPVVRQARIGVHLTGWDFYFVLSALFGLWALHRLALVHEDGERSRAEMLEFVFGRGGAHFGRPPAAAGAAPPEPLSEDLLEDGPAS